jgi:hypothetical protein
MREPEFERFREGVTSQMERKVAITLSQVIDRLVQRGHITHFPYASREIYLHASARMPLAEKLLKIGMLILSDSL